MIKKDAVLLGEERDKIASFDSIVVKPRHGTEKIDLETIESIRFDLDHPAIKKIRKYDSCLVQEYIEPDLEFKVLYFSGEFHFPKAIKEDIKDLLDDFLEVIESFGAKNEIIVPQIFTLDIIKSQGKYIILEANIRPAAVYKFN